MACLPTSARCLTPCAHTDPDGHLRREHTIGTHFASPKRIQCTQMICIACAAEPNQQLCWQTVCDCRWRNCSEPPHDALRDPLGMLDRVNDPHLIKTSNLSAQHRYLIVTQHRVTLFHSDAQLAASSPPSPSFSSLFSDVGRRSCESCTPSAGMPSCISSPCPCSLHAASDTILSLRSTPHAAQQHTAHLSYALPLM